MISILYTFIANPILSAAGSPILTGVGYVVKRYFIARIVQYKVGAARERITRVYGFEFALNCESFENCRSGL